MEEITEQTVDLLAGQIPGLGLVDISKMSPRFPRRTTKRDTLSAIHDSGENFLDMKVGFDVFRFEDGKVVRHWENLLKRQMQNDQNKQANLSTNTLAMQKELLEANQSLASGFVDEVLIKGSTTTLANHFKCDNFDQRNSQALNGLAGLDKALKSTAAQGGLITYEKLHRVLGKGNFVLTMCLGTIDRKPKAFYDLFCFEDGAIKDYWDAIEALPMRSKWKNQNGNYLLSNLP